MAGLFLVRGEDRSAFGEGIAVEGGAQAQGSFHA